MPKKMSEYDIIKEDVMKKRGPLPNRGMRNLPLPITPKKPKMKPMPKPPKKGPRLKKA